MFLLRSAFWLILAFVVIRPEVDMRDTAANLSGDAMTRGSQFIVQQIDAIECDSLTCHGGKAVVVAAINAPPLASAPMPAMGAAPAIPLPRPRPDRAV